jgi:hypothetical protein
VRRVALRLNPRRKRSKKPPALGVSEVVCDLDPNMK